MVAKPLCPLYKNIIKPLDRARSPELRYDMIRETEIEGIYEIKDSKKVGFAKDICKINTPQTFAFFKDLFEVIDEICNYENDSYII